MVLVQFHAVAHAHHSPLVALKVLQLDAQCVVLVVGQHVDVLVAHPELLGGITEAILVVGPVAVEVLAWIAKIVTSLNDLHGECE
jgi:predicted transcriptional regulator